MNNMNLKLKTVHGDSGCCSKSWEVSRAYILPKKYKYITLYLSQIIVDVHDFILGWKIVYLFAQRLSFCP